ncbi:MAG: hypothetical protein ACQESF_02655 [Nanobdellota archaeon]
MNEFLQQLRTASNNKKRNNNSYKNKNKSTGNNRYPERKNEDNKKQNTSPITATIAAEIITSIDNIEVSMQDQMLCAERISDAEERQADALDHIANMFSDLINQIENVPAEAQEEQLQEANMVDEKSTDISPEEADIIKKTSRTYIKNLIKTLKEQKFTYDDIADYLTKNDFPTFSGRGKWHAQTIHRLFKEIKNS